MKLEIDAEFASLIPPMDAEEYMQLEANIVAEGCRDPLIAWGNILIDGHNRLRICEKHNIQYQVVIRNFSNRSEALEYIIHNQFGRRNLSSVNRSLLALKLEPLYKAKALERQRQSSGRGKKGTQNSAYLFSGETRRAVAKVAGVSHDTIDKVKKIVEQGTPAQVKRIKQGGKGNSVRAVYSEVRGKQLPPPEDTAPAASPIPDASADMPEPPHEPASQEVPTDILKLPQVPAAPAFPPSPDKEQEEESVPEPEEEPEPCEDDLEQIKRYVAELKNPDLNRSYTTEMFVVEYEAFAGRFIRSLGVFDGAPYSDIYPLLSDNEKEALSTLSAEMGRAIREFNILIKG